MEIINPTIGVHESARGALDNIIKNVDIFVDEHKRINKAPYVAEF